MKVRWGTWTGEFYQNKVNKTIMMLATVFIIISLVVPDLGVGMFVGSTLLSGISIKTKLKSLKNELKTRWKLLF